MIKKILFLLISHAFFMQCMEKAYTPGFQAQHPKFANMLASTVSGVAGSAGVYIVSKLFSPNNKTVVRNSLIAFAGLATVIYIRNLYKKPNLLDTMLCHPEVALQYSHTIRGKMAKEGSQKNLKISDDITIVQKLVKKYETDSPFVLLGECTALDCPLSRSFNKKYRKEYENRVCEELLNVAQQKENKVTYVSFACGGMFQDLVILTKFLAQRPDATLTIHLIDFQHTAYVACGKLLANNNQVTEAPCNPQTIMQQLVNKGKKHQWINESDGIDVVKKDFSLNINEYDMKHKEFLLWLKNNYPKASITLYSHASAEGFLKSLEKNIFEAPDIVTTSDIEDEMSLLKKALLNYATLCAAILTNKNPNVKNIALLRNFPKPHARLVSFSLNQQQNEKEETFEGFDKKSYTLFSKIQFIQ